jgi:hypothetical protein
MVERFVTSIGSVVFSFFMPLDVRLRFISPGGGKGNRARCLATVATGGIGSNAL